MSGDSATSPLTPSEPSSGPVAPERSTKRRHVNADETAAKIAATNRRHRQKTSLALRWVKMHEPHVWLAIVAKVDGA